MIVANRGICVRCDESLLHLFSGCICPGAAFVFGPETVLHPHHVLTDPVCSICTAFDGGPLQAGFLCCVCVPPRPVCLAHVFHDCSTLQCPAMGYAR